MDDPLQLPYNTGSYSNCVGVIICRVCFSCAKQMTEIDVAASELDVCRDIAGVIVNSGEEFSSCSRYSFEFIEANLSVPAKPSGFE